uniref:Complement system-related protein CFH3 n=1 Tax=Cyprinus carpio TaxID=7962 RepID=A0A5Q2U827_CYPCA|nr:complement system-related protein CFH3 [Cyprinus carpio]
MLKMKYCKIFLFLLLMIMGVSTNAQEVTCEGEQLINVDIVVGNPGKAPPYKPGHILVFRCTDVKLKMHGQQVIECLSNGKWDYPYPKCGDVTCLLNTKKENIKMDRFPDFECPVTPGYNLTFSCNGQGLILKGQREITCQSNGEWSSPFPKCEDKHTEGHTTSCGPPPDVNDADTIELKKHEYNTGERVEYSCFNKYTLDLRPPFSRYLTCEQGEWRGTIKPYYYFIGDKKLGAITSYRCESGYRQTAAKATCTRDGWTPKPLCAEIVCAAPNIPNAEIDGGQSENYKIYSRIQYKCRSGFEPKQPVQITCNPQGQWTGIQQCTVSEKCGPPPHVNDADTTELKKDEYNTGERVEYSCFNKYTLDLRPSFSRYLTCVQGEWRGLNLK